MTSHTFIHKPTGWAVVPGEWPEKPNYCESFEYYIPICGDERCACKVKRINYKAEIELAISTAIDIRAEDQDWAKRLIFVRSKHYYPHAEVEEVDADIKDWIPQDYHPYRLEVEYEIKENLANIMSNNPFEVKKVAILKPIEVAPKVESGQPVETQERLVVELHKLILFEIQNGNPILSPKNTYSTLSKFHLTRK